jgi:tryptophan-rich sensory protein
MQPEHILAILRGWYPHWQMELRVFPLQVWALLGLFFAVSAYNVWTYNRKGER